MQRPYLSGVLERFKSLKQEQPEMRRLKKLNATGKLQGPVLTEILNHLDIDPQILANPGTNEAQKIIAKQITKVSALFRGKILQTEVEGFMKSIPSLMQTEPGREKVINGLLTMSEASELEYRATRVLQDKYQGQELPYDFDQQVFDSIEPQLDQLAQNFERGEVGPAGIVELDRSNPEDELVMKNFIRQAKGNVQQAVEMARKRGYALRKKG